MLRLVGSNVPQPAPGTNTSAQACVDPSFVDPLAFPLRINRYPETIRATKPRCATAPASLHLLALERDQGCNIQTLSLRRDNVSVGLLAKLIDTMFGKGCPRTLLEMFSAGEPATSR